VGNVSICLLELFFRKKAVRKISRINLVTKIFIFLISLMGFFLFNRTMEKELKFLSKVFQILADEDVFDTKASGEGSVIKFKFPHELKVTFL
jgi:hypothetical protein